MTTVDDLTGRSLLRLGDCSAAELVGLLDLAAELKAARRDGREEQRLAGREIALVVEHDVARTRRAFEVAAHEQGAHVTAIDAAGTPLGFRETVKDTARVLGRLYDAIEYRGFAEETSSELARWAGVPVYHCLSDDGHPPQVLADLLTMREHVDKPLREIVCCYLGNARDTRAEAFLLCGARLGMDLRIAAPRSLWPAEDVLARARDLAAAGGAIVTVTEDVPTAVLECDVLLTDAWASLADRDEVWAERIEELRPYQVNMEVLELTRNAEVRFLHGLPAFHNADTTVGRRVLQRHGMAALEVTEDVFESPASRVFDEAENRLHAIKAVLVATLGTGRCG